MSSSPPNKSHLRVLSALLVIVCVSFFVQPATSFAADLSKFKAGNIISDSVFYNGNAMSVQDVQNFLNSKMPNCTINNGQPSRAAGAPAGTTFIAETCLKDYRQATPNMAAQPGVCSAYQGNSSETAAAIITKVGQACNISQQVLLVLLQKEQSLITDSWPSILQYNRATGFACYDNGQPCVQNYAGFFYQVWSAARQFQRYGNSPFTWFPVGQVSNILYQANKPECGTKQVYIENRATAALYYYTPYTPNDAAISAGYGTGDACSSYGNRNFYQFFVDWFGEGHDPIFNLEQISSVPGGIRVVGWVVDPNSVNSTQIHAYVNGAGNIISASNYREDVARAFPSLGGSHGFDSVIPIAKNASTQNVCLYAINIGLGSNKLVACKQLSPMTGGPIGSFSATSISDGKTQVSGWAFDPDTIDSIPIHIYVNGVGYVAYANSTNSEIAASYPAYGSNHGFSIELPIRAGNNLVCVYGIEIKGQGQNALLGCKTVVGNDGSPIGQIESLNVSPGNLEIRGWAFDPDTQNPITLHVYMNGNGTVTSTSLTRQDIANLNGGKGVNSGFSINVPTKSGNNTVCIYAIESSGTGTNKLIGCKSIQGLSGSPFGNIDSVSVVAGMIQVRGWAIDPDTVSPSLIHVYVGSSGYAVTASELRGDVANAFPIYGANHGFNFAIPTSSGSKTVCIYAIETMGNGSNQLLGCRRVIVP